MSDGASPAELEADGGDLVDENGIDRDQIRQMLALAPMERLRRMQEFVESILEIRDLNEIKRRTARPKDLTAFPILQTTLDEMTRRR